ncbi:transportin-1-like [Lolium rigidum]|uniref:transportin-1-like n=1 Tax=Lolium rigidum TaxID=89674 RepID=UPI001F5D44FE|nr:transportin-1-like [Lolium rigidum]
MKDSIKEVALKACQFWCAYCDDSRPYGELKEFLPNLITTFLQNMVLTKEDRSHAVFEENLDDVYTLDLRICSAAGLTGICGVLWDDAFPVFMSLIEAKMAQMDDRAWKEREAAVASIGAIAKAHVTKPRFSQILALLIPPLDDNFSLVRFSTCRTISVCGKLIIEGLGHTTGDEQFMVFLMGLVRRTADSDRIVKEAAIAALESLQEEIKTKQLQAEVQDALQSYIQLHGQQKWEHLLSNLDPAAVQWLSRSLRKRDGARRPHHNEHIYFFHGPGPTSLEESTYAACALTKTHLVKIIM